MKILSYEWAAYTQQDFNEICKKQGVQLDSFRWNFKNKNCDEEFEVWFAKNVDIKKYDLLFSINYWPMLSKVAQRAGVKYIAWCYDNPLNVINIEETLGNSVNRVVFFDKIQALKYINQGFETVYYMPLAVNTDRLVRLSPKKSDWEKYGAEVSFVGSLYQSRINDIKGLMNDYSKGFIEAVMNSQEKIYGYYLFDEVITDEFVKSINNSIQEKNPETEFVLLKEALTFAMASEVTRRERLILLSLMGRRFDTKLYSYDSDVILESIKKMGTVDYVSQMPMVFACSKINLNPVLRCIQSGIPLRALDICGAGGLLLSSYQPELAEQFVDGQEIVLYESMEDAVAKADFLLKNEDIRQTIAENGRKKVFENYSMMDRISEILAL